MGAGVLKKCLIFLIGFLVFQNINFRVSEHMEMESTTAAFESIEKDFKGINTNVEIEFNKLPKYEKQSSDQPIKDALEFIKFTKDTLTDTMEQNTELLDEIKEFDKR